MDKILVLATPEADGTLGRPALEALAVAKELGGAVAVGLWGAEVQKAADSVAGCGAARVLGVSGPDFAEARYGSDAAAAEALAKAAGASLVLAPGTSRLARILPGVAHRLGGRADTHVTGLQAGPDGIAASRGYYRQRIESVISRSARPWVLSLDPGARAPIAPAPGRAAVEPVAVSLSDGARRTKVEGLRAPAGGGQTIRPDAGLLFVAGAGWCKKQPSGQVRTAEAEKLIREFIDKSQASLGSSKSLVDQKGEGQAVISFLTHLNQVGQTGSTPRHPKGLSACCHGEEPHVVGWRFVSQRRAINLDPNCGWAKGKADVVYVADAFEVMAKVNAMLS
jgi:electron transfer flavoprotein alpha subunit